MIDQIKTVELLKDNGLVELIPNLPNYFNLVLRHGDYNKFNRYLEELPDIEADEILLNSTEITLRRQADLTTKERENLINKLKNFIPWRKGPYNLFGVKIETEWRSDLKWDRLKNDITDLSGKVVLDVGCGNGYHCWRIKGAGAKFVLGIDPYLLSNFQFVAVNKYIRSDGNIILPIKMEQMPQNSERFDTVFSMGVLYHCRSPFEHLAQLKGALKSGGELVLETLIIEGGKNEVLVPSSRYAKMRNVWFIPSPLALERWLKRAGFKNIRLINISVTTSEEQRRTDWMPWESLDNFLNPSDKNLTIEGYPSPRRAIFICEK